MKIIKDFTQSGIRISIFSWNNKYLIKYEKGLLEQTFKVSELDILEAADLEKFYVGDFFDLVQKRFKEMGESLQKQLENL